MSEIIVIAAPQNFASGGPELCHQLCDALRNLGKEAYMYYYGFDGMPVQNGRHDAYNKYNTVETTDLELLNMPSTVFVIPEGALPLYNLGFLCKYYIWWLSVTTYVEVFSHIINKEKDASFVSYDLSQNENKYDYDVFHFAKKNEVRHLSQSAFSSYFLKNYLHIDEKYIFELSDYLNSDFFNVNIPYEYKQNYVVYNPKKGLEQLAPIIVSSPQFKWIPIQNMTSKDVANLLRLSKVYIDFGSHPGKDRIPREAAISGCCIITNRMGSANYYEDVPIPDEYKFNSPTEQTKEIVCLIQDIFEHYETHRASFKEYCDMILGEEEKFMKDVKRIFVDK